MEWRQWENMGEIRIVPFSLATAQLKGLHIPPFEGVLSAQAANTAGNTCGPARSDTSWKCNYSEDQGELVRQCLLSSPCQYPFKQCCGKWWQPYISFSLGLKPAAQKMWLPSSFGSSSLWGRILAPFVLSPVVLSPVQWPSLEVKDSHL